jgi:hypothetical protein
MGTARPAGAAAAREAPSARYFARSRMASGLASPEGISAAFTMVAPIRVFCTPVYAR